MPCGTVKFFNDHKDFGFIVPDGGGPEMFVHVSALKRSRLVTLYQGQRISYDVVTDYRTGQRCAENLYPEAAAPRLFGPQYIAPARPDNLRAKRHLPAMANAAVSVDGNHQRPTGWNIPTYYYQARAGLYTTGQVVQLQTGRLNVAIQH